MPRRNRTDKIRDDNLESSPAFLSVEYIAFIIFLLFVSLYDFSFLAAWYWSHNYRIPSYSTGSLSSISSNPFLSSIPDYHFDLRDIFRDNLPGETLGSSIKSLLANQRNIPMDMIMRQMKSNIDVIIKTPQDDMITTNSWLEWSIIGKSLDTPEHARSQSELLRHLMLDIRVDNNVLNIPNGYLIDYYINGKSIEMKVDLATYSLTHGAHEVRVSILMLASSVSVFYYIPENDLIKKTINPIPVAADPIDEEITSTSNEPIVIQSNRPSDLSNRLSVDSIFNVASIQSNLPPEDSRSENPDLDVYLRRSIAERLAFTQSKNDDGDNHDDDDNEEIYHGLYKEEKVSPTFKIYNFPTEKKNLRIVNFQQYDITFQSNDGTIYLNRDGRSFQSLSLDNGPVHYAISLPLPTRNKAEIEVT